MEYFVFLIPIAFILISVYYFSKEVTWWELCVQILITVITLSIMKYSYYSYNVSDTEYLGGITTQAIYDEDWNEKVSCRHPIYCTRTVRSGKTTSTQSYVCGHHHAYDVDYHPANYKIFTTLGNYSISASKYQELKNKFGNVSFVDMQRCYHSIDGDRYVSEWNKAFETIEPVSESHNYENRVQCSKNVLGYNDVSEEDIKQYGLLEYPDVNGLLQNCIIPSKYSTPELNTKINRINGVIGTNKQARFYVMIFENQPLISALKEEELLVGGNKNEVILCIGVNDDAEINWTKVFSWSEVQDMKINIADYALEQNKLNTETLDHILSFSYQEINNKFKRKEFSDFNYLTIDISDTQMFWLYISIFLINAGVFAFNIFNEFKNDK